MIIYGTLIKTFKHLLIFLISYKLLKGKDFGFSSHLPEPPRKRYSTTRLAVDATFLLKCPFFLLSLEKSPFIGQA